MTRGRTNYTDEESAWLKEHYGVLAGMIHNLSQRKDRLFKDFCDQFSKNYESCGMDLSSLEKFQEEKFYYRAIYLYNNGQESAVKRRKLKKVTNIKAAVKAQQTTIEKACRVYHI